MTAPLRLLNVDNYQTFRDGLALAIQSQPVLHLQAEVESAAQVYTAIDLSKIDVAVVNIDLPDRSGLEVCRRLVRTHPRLPVLILAYNDWNVYLVASKSSGAAGFLLRQSSTSTLLQQIIQSKSGPIYTDEQVARIEKWKNTVGLCLASLRPREWQIMFLVVAGTSNRDIAKALQLKENTIEKHMTNLLHKLDVKSRSKLTGFVLSHHLDALESLGENARYYV